MNGDEHVSKRSRRSVTDDEYKYDDIDQSANDSSVDQEYTESTARKKGKANKRDLNWDAQYEALIEYSKKHGSCNVRTGYTVELEEKNNVNLYAWLALQRRHKRNGKLRKDREMKLQALVDQGKLAWVGTEVYGRDTDDEQPATVSQPKSSSWDSHFDAVILFGDEHGHYNVPIGQQVILQRGKTPIDLGLWLDKQRSLYRENSLPEDLKYKIHLLIKEGRLQIESSNAFMETVDTSLAPVNSSVDAINATWEVRYQAALKYAIEKGHLNIDTIGVTVTCSDGSSCDLGLWLRCQRLRYRLQSLRPDRALKLETLAEIGRFAWISPEELARMAAEKEKIEKEEETLWTAWYNVLVWHGKNFGHCNLDSQATVSLPDGSEAELGKWLARQRSAIKHGRMTATRLDRMKILIEECKLDSAWATLVASKYGDLSKSNLQQPELQVESIPDSTTQSSEVTTKPSKVDIHPQIDAQYDAVYLSTIQNHAMISKDLEQPQHVLQYGP